MQIVISRISHDERLKYGTRILLIVIHAPLCTRYDKNNWKSFSHIPKLANLQQCVTHIEALIVDVCWYSTQFLNKENNCGVRKKNNSRLDLMPTMYAIIVCAHLENEKKHLI